MALDPAIVAAITGAGSGGGTASTSGPLIPIRITGPYSATDTSSANAAEHSIGPKGKGKQVTTKKEVTPDQAAVDIYGWTPDEQKSFAQRAWYLGLLDSPQDLEGAFKVWKWAVDQAANYSAAGKPMDPRDVMDILASGSPDALKNRDHRNGWVTTQKARSINLSNPTEAKALITQMFQQSMGRDPTDAEIRTLTASLNSQQQANPTETTTTAKYDAQGNLVTSDSTTSGGINAQQYVSDQTRNNPEAASYQAGTVYWNALLQALGAGA